MLKRYLVVDKEGWFYIFRDEPVWDEIVQNWVGKSMKEGADECIGRRMEREGVNLDDLELIPKKYRGMTWEDEPAVVWVTKKIRVFTKQKM